MSKGPMTIIEQFDGMTDELRTALFSAAQPTAIDWTKVKGLLGQFLQAFGPILIQLLISTLVPAEPTEK
jgi:hypothetical protein